ncbi:hypothetical protein Acy02nite_56920 [Actinoplanes cyaneus]|uniref:DUF4352 domain-containing protein n=1 Tax=Actinoplanes cyaneus TaxID=52696 RepID=A0A919IN87_9ACTN|nr:DUF4352 domain-containing protein [Actinoplanes cyaneus]MCW2139895.1 protein of unknown function (DUF4352) [Actinoplanes cyaneus]GID67811.1 hypothetical protein Acy02nite_56920 [Actinoplanes cyaneus]
MSRDLRRRPRPVRAARGVSPLKVTLAVAGSVIAVIVLFAAGIAAEQYGRRPAAATATTRPPAKAGPGLGDAVRDGKLEFVVSRVDCTRRTVGAERLTRTAAGRYCVVSMSVRNIGDGAKFFVGHGQKAYDASGAEYAGDELAGVYANRGTESFLRRLAPGEKVAGKLVFDVPENGSLTSLEVHDSPLSHGAVIILGQR